MKIVPWEPDDVSGLTVEFTLSVWIRNLKFWASDTPRDLVEADTEPLLEEQDLSPDYRGSPQGKKKVLSEDEYMIHND